MSTLSFFNQFWAQCLCHRPSHSSPSLFQRSWSISSCVLRLKKAAKPSLYHYTSGVTDWSQCFWSKTIITARVSLDLWLSASGMGTLCMEKSTEHISSGGSRVAVNGGCNHGDVKVRRKDGDFRSFREYLKNGAFIRQAVINWHRVRHQMLPLLTYIRAKGY